MANVAIAVEFVLRQEDSTLSGVITNDPNDPGGRTRYGIAETYHPELTNCMFFSKDMSIVAALQIARGVYESNYADPLCISDIYDQNVANKLLSLGVNLGVEAAAKMLQAVVKVQGDGRIGPLTLHAMEMYRPGELLAELDAAAVQHYKDVVAANPKKEKFLKGWESRANAV